MEGGRQLVAVSGARQNQSGSLVSQQSLGSELFSPSGSMSIEHAGQSPWEQGAVGLLCAVGGYLLAYWSMQGIIGAAVIVLCVAFSTIVTAALCHYYDRAVRPGETADRLESPRGRTALSEG